MSFKPPPIQRVGSFKAEASRAGFGPVIVAIGGKCELQMLYKTGRQELEFYKLEHSKSIWGQIMKIEVISNKSKHSGEVCEYLRMSNVEGDKLDFKVKGFDPTIGGFSDFSQMFCELRTGRSIQLLSTYLTLLTTSPGFVLHNPDIHNKHGIKVEKNESVIDELSSQGGTLDELELFFSAAKASAMFGESYDSILGSLTGITNKKRKRSEDGKIVTKNLPSEINKAFSAEVQRPDGTEAEFSKCFLGRFDVPVQNLLDDKSSHLPPLCQFKV